MTKLTADIVPFGKYRGRPVEEVLIEDPSYLQWLTGQDWFRVKYVELHQTIINRGAEPEETPEHNAMQVQFLEDEFCLRFANQVHQAAKQIEWFHRHADEAEAREDIVTRQHERLRRLQETLSDPHSKWKHENIALKIAECERMQSSGLRVFFGRAFESGGVDVKLTVEISEGQGPGRGEKIEPLHEILVVAAIELKPSVGDDYPVVLRQMRANHSNVLFLREYTGKGATREQFVKTFNTAGIAVVFADQVAATESDHD
jgi:hypothetical protein